MPANASSKSAPAHTCIKRDFAFSLVSVVLLLMTMVSLAPAQHVSSAFGPRARRAPDRRKVEGVVRPILRDNRKLTQRQNRDLPLAPPQFFPAPNAAFDAQGFGLGNTPPSAGVAAILDVRGLVRAEGKSVVGGEKGVSSALGRFVLSPSVPSGKSANRTPALPLTSQGTNAQPPDLAPNPKVAETNVSWQGPSGTGGAGNWSTKGDWSGGVVPNNGSGHFYSVMIPPSASTVTLNQNAMIDALALSSTLATDNVKARTLTIGSTNAAGVLWNYGTINWGDGTLAINISQAGKGANVTETNYAGIINLNGSSASLVLNDGGNHSTFVLVGNPSSSYGSTINLAGGTISGSHGDETLENVSNTIQGYGAISSLALINGGNGLIEANGGTGQALTITPSGGFTNYGSLTVNGAGGMTVNGALTNTESFGQYYSGLTQYGGQIYVASTLAVSGNVTNQGYATTDVSTGGRLNVGGAFINSTPLDTGDVEVDAGGSLTVSGAFRNVDNSGNLTGTWYLYGGRVNYDGKGGINNAQDITTVANGASLTLEGTGGFFGKTNPAHNHLAPLATVNGFFELTNGANFTTAGNFLNNPSSIYVSGISYEEFFPLGVEVGGDSNLTVGGSFENVDNSGNLTGIWQIYNGNINYDGKGGVNGNQDITTNDAVLWLFGSNSGGFFGKTDTSHNHLASLDVNNLSFQLYNGATFTTAGNFTNNGSVTLVGSQKFGMSSLNANGAFENNGLLRIWDGSVSTAGSFTNNGYVSFEPGYFANTSGGTLTVGGAFNSVSKSGTLTGQWDIEDNGEVYYDGSGGINATQDITTIASGASVDLLGPSSGFFGKTDPSHNHLAPLAVVDGTFETSQGFTTTGDFTNNGTVDLVSYTVVGSTSTGSLTITGAFHSVDKSGNLTGNWSLSGDVYYDGTGGVHGAQDITTIASGASLSLTNAAGFFGKTDPSHNHLASLGVNDGTFELRDAALTTAGAFTNNGTVDLLDGTLTVTGAFHNVDKSGNLTGNWFLLGNVSYDGSGVDGDQDITTISSGASVMLGESGGFWSTKNPHHNHMQTLAVNNGTFTLYAVGPVVTGGNFTNNGAMALESATALTIAGDFTNNGSFTIYPTDVNANGRITVNGSFTNVDKSGNLTGNWTLAGELYYDGSGGINGNQDITTIAKGAALTLDATDATLYGASNPGFFGKTDPSHNHLAALSTVNGTFALENGAALTTVGGFTNNGTVSVLDFCSPGITGCVGFAGSLTVGGTFNNVSSTGVLTGNWDLGGNLYYDGKGGINGRQDITTIASGASLTLDATDAVEFGANNPGIFGKTNPSLNHLAPLAVNDGTFDLVNGASFTTLGAFTNNGTVSLLDTGVTGFSGTLTITGAFHNVDKSGNLTGNWVLGGGVYYDGSSGINQSQDITTIASGASLTLDGTDSTASPGFFGKANPSHNHLVLATNNGTFGLQNTASYTTPGDFTNNGTVVVESTVLNYALPPDSAIKSEIRATSGLTVGGTFHNVDNLGNLTGNWVLDGYVYYDGTGGVNGTQDISAVAKGASLTLDGTDASLFGSNAPGFYGKTNLSLNHLAPLATNNGTFALQNGATFATAAGFANNGTLNILGTALNFGSGYSTQTLSSNLTVTGNFSNTGTLDIGAESAPTGAVTGAYKQAAAPSTLTAGGPPRSITSIAGGAVSGQNGNGLVNGTNSGAMPGSIPTLPASPSAASNALQAAGLLSITGTYTQTTGGTLDEAIGGPTADALFGQLDITSTALLDGTLNIDLVDSFVPTVGEKFDIVNAKTVTCGWTINGLAIDSSEHFAETCSKGEVLLTVDSGALGPIVGSGSSAVPQPDGSATPEPGSLLQLGTVLLGLPWFLRRSERKADLLP